MTPEPVARCGGALVTAWPFAGPFVMRWKLVAAAVLVLALAVAGALLPVGDWATARVDRG